MPIRQQGYARLWANDKAAAGLSPMKPAPGITLAKERLHRLARQNVTAHFFYLRKYFPQPRSKTFERPARVVSG